MDTPMASPLPGTSLSDPVGGLPDEQWDTITGPHFYSSSAWPKYYAHNSTRRAGAVAAVTESDPLAATPISKIDESSRESYRWNGLLNSSGLPRITPTGFTVGTLEGYQTHLLSASGADPVAAAEFLISEARSLRDSQPDPQNRVCVW